MHSEFIDNKYLNVKTVLLCYVASQTHFRCEWGQTKIYLIKLHLEQTICLTHFLFSISTGNGTVYEATVNK